MSYRQQLASAILGRLDEARHQPDSLPAVFGENFVTETGATMSDFAHAVKVLETHDLIRYNKVDVHGYAITEPGKAAVRIQSTPMMALVKVLLASPNNQESRASLHTANNVLGMMDWKDYCDLINIAERSKLVTQHRIPKSEPMDFMILLRNTTDLEVWTDFKALEDLLKSDFELPLTPRHQQLLVEGMMAKTSSKLYYLCPGPDFEIGFPFGMVDVEDVQTRKEAEYTHPDGDYSNYYTKVELLARFMRPIPVLERSTSVFLQETTQERPHLGPHWCLRVKTELGISTALALFFVSKATSDVAAVAFTYPKIGTIRVFISKNTVAEADHHHALKLLGWLHGNLFTRYGDFVNFASAGFKVILGHCSQMFRKRVQDLPLEHLVMLKSHLLSNADNFNKAKDVRFKSYANNIRKIPSEAAAGMLTKIVDISTRICINPSADSFVNASANDYDDGYVLSGYAHLLWQSPAFKAILDTFAVTPEIRESIRENLGKVGVYFYGVLSLWKVLAARCGKEAAGKVSCQAYRLDFVVVNSIPKRTIALTVDWYDLVKRHVEKRQHGRPLRISKERILHYIVPDAAEIIITPQAEVLYHCEQRLADVLKSKGVTKAVFGISKSCCELCSHSLQARNDVGDMWLAARGHQEIYQTLLPDMAGIDSDTAMLRTFSMVGHVDRLFSLFIDQINVADSSPVPRYNREIDSEEEEDLLSLFEEGR